MMTQVLESSVHTVLYFYPQFTAYPLLLSRVDRSSYFNEHNIDKFSKAFLEVGLLVILDPIK